MMPDASASLPSSLPQGPERALQPGQKAGEQDEAQDQEAAEGREPPGLGAGGGSWQEKKKGARGWGEVGEEMGGMNRWQKSRNLE